MQPDQNNMLGNPQQQLYQKGSRAWIDLRPYCNYIQFPDVSLVTEKQSLAEASATINRYPDAAARVNSDGMVLMRGLLRTPGGGNIATGDIIATLPEFLMPQHPQQLRFYGGTCLLALNELRQLKVDLVHIATSFVILGNVCYYLD